MKTVALTQVVDAVEALFDLATDDGVLLRLPDGKIFFAPDRSQMRLKRWMTLPMKLHEPARIGR